VRFGEIVGAYIQRRRKTKSITRDEKNKIKV
jgi:hypothetical protein